MSLLYGSTTFQVLRFLALKNSPLQLGLNLSMPKKVYWRRDPCYVLKGNALTLNRF